MWNGPAPPPFAQEPSLCVKFFILLYERKVAVRQSGQPFLLGAASTTHGFLGIDFRRVETKEYCDLRDLTEENQWASLAICRATLAQSRACRHMPKQKSSHAVELIPSLHSHRLKVRLRRVSSHVHSENQKPALASKFFLFVIRMKITSKMGVSLARK